MINKDQTKNTEENSEEPKPKEEKLDFEKFQKDIAKFVKGQQATGQIPEDFDIEKLSDAQKRELITDYNKWVEQDRPKPVMPKPKEEKQDKILRVYRRRSFNEEKLTAVVEGQHVPMGIELVPIYAMIDGKPDKTNQIGTDRKYTIPYSQAKAKELVERCEKESAKPKFYITEESGPTFRIKIKANFFRPFDDIISDALSGKTV